MYAVLAVAVYNVVYGTLVVLLEHIDIYHVLAHEQFFAHLDNLVFTVLVEEDDVIDVRAVGDKLVLLQRCSDESLGAVYV